MDEVTYRNAFCGPDPLGPKYGPPTYTTTARPVHYRGFTIYQRIPNERRGSGCGCADTVIDGWCIQNTVTVDGAQRRIDALLRGDDFEHRIRVICDRLGIKLPGTQLTIDDAA